MASYAENEEPLAEYSHELILKRHDHSIAGIPEAHQSSTMSLNLAQGENWLRLVLAGGDNTALKDTQEMHDDGCRIPYPSIVSLEHVGMVDAPTRDCFICIDVDGPWSTIKDMRSREPLSGSVEDELFQVCISKRHVDTDEAREYHSPECLERRKLRLLRSGDRILTRSSDGDAVGLVLEYHQSRPGRGFQMEEEVAQGSETLTNKDTQEPVAQIMLQTQASDEDSDMDEGEATQVFPRPMLLKTQSSCYEEQGTGNNVGTSLDAYEIDMQQAGTGTGTDETEQPVSGAFPALEIDSQAEEDGPFLTAPETQLTQTSEESDLGQGAASIPQVDYVGNKSEPEEISNDITAAHPTVERPQTLPQNETANEYDDPINEPGQPLPQNAVADEHEDVDSMNRPTQVSPQKDATNETCDVDPTEEPTQLVGDGPTEEPSQMSPQKDAANDADDIGPIEEPTQLYGTFSTEEPTPVSPQKEVANKSDDIDPMEEPTQPDGADSMEEPTQALPPSATFETRLPVASGQTSGGDKSGDYLKRNATPSPVMRATALAKTSFDSLNQSTQATRLRSDDLQKAEASNETNEATERGVQIPADRGHIDGGEDGIFCDGYDDGNTSEALLSPQKPPDTQASDQSGKGIAIIVNKDVVEDRIDVEHRDVGSTAPANETMSETSSITEVDLVRASLDTSNVLAARSVAQPQTKKGNDAAPETADDCVDETLSDSSSITEADDDIRASLDAATRPITQSNIQECKKMVHEVGGEESIEKENKDAGAIPVERLSKEDELHMGAGSSGEAAEKAMSDSSSMTEVDGHPTKKDENRITASPEAVPRRALIDLSPWRERILVSGEECMCQQSSDHLKPMYDEKNERKEASMNGVIEAHEREVKELDSLTKQANCEALNSQSTRGDNKSSPTKPSKSIMDDSSSRSGEDSAETPPSKSDNHETGNFDKEREAKNKENDTSKEAGLETPGQRRSRRTKKSPPKCTPQQATTEDALKTPASRFKTKRDRESHNVTGTSTRKRTRNAEVAESSDGEPIRVLFTGVDVTARHKKMLTTIEADLVEKIEDAASATHVIAGDDKTSLLRTAKLMIGISRTSKIVHMNWLVQSAKARIALPCNDFLLLNDKAAEEKYNFIMREALQRGDQRRRNEELLLSGYSVYFCNGVAGHKTPPEAELKLIIDAAGGQWLSSISSNAIRDLNASKIIIVKSETPEKKKQKTAEARDVEKAVKQGSRSCHASWLFQCIIRQSLD